jgi:phosphodiesterase/alkaline phosphatase D-like protein
LHTAATRLVLLLCLGAALVFAGTAAAATAPTASTGPVSAVGPTTATVTGSVNPEGTATTWHVEYGTTTTYGAQTAAVSAGSGTTAQAVSASLTALKPATTYHYRFVATSSTAGTGYGADGILVTSSLPAAVTASATAVTPTSATLNGTVDPSGRPTTWYFEYGTSTSYGTKTPVKDAGSGSGSSAVSAAVTGLKTGRTYHFRIVATNDAGTSRGSDQTFVTSAAPTVTTKAASSVTDSSARLNGSVNPNGQATSVYFEFGTSTSYGTKTPAASAGAGTSARNMAAAVSALTGGATYHFRIVATSAAGTTLGTDLTFTTTGRPVPQTGIPGNVTGTSAMLNGTVDPNGHTTSWYFEYGKTTAYGTKTASQNAGSTKGAQAVSVPISGLTPGTSYHFRLVATSSAGTAYGVDAAFTTVGPAVTIASSSATVIYGHRVTLRGKVSTQLANVSVAVFAKRITAGSFTSVATVLTGVGGTWSLSVKPAILTTYKAIFGGGSAVTTVSVRPAVSLTVSHGRFTTHVAAAHSLRGRIVQLQRHLLNGRWVTISRNRLNSRSIAVFSPKLPRGRSVLRVAISASSGYLAGYSALLAVRR